MSLGSGGRKYGRNKQKCTRYKAKHTREKNLRKRLVKEANKYRITLKQLIKQLKHKPRGLDSAGDIV